MNNSKKILYFQQNSNSTSAKWLLQLREKIKQGKYQIDLEKLSERLTRVLEL